MPTYVILQANNGQYVSAEGGGVHSVVASSSAAKELETFELINVDDDLPKPPTYGQKVYLKACNHKYVCAENGGGREVVANRDDPGPWQIFTLDKPSTPGGGANAVDPTHPTPIALRTHNGQYVSAEGGGGRKVVANRNAIGPWETLTLHVVGAQTGHNKKQLRPLFPVHAVRDDQVTDGNHMHTGVTIDKSGTLSGFTHTWTDNTWQGVHAVSNVALVGENQETLWASFDCICGVAGKLDPTGPHNRTENFSATVPNNVLDSIRGVVIVHRADPHSDFRKWLKDHSGDIVHVVKQIVTVLASEVGALQVGEPPSLPSCSPAPRARRSPM